MPRLFRCTFNLLRYFIQVHIRLKTGYLLLFFNVYTVHIGLKEPCVPTSKLRVHTQYTSLSLSLVVRLILKSRLGCLKPAVLELPDLKLGVPKKTLVWKEFILNTGKIHSFIYSRLNSKSFTLCQCISTKLIM